MTDTTTYSIFSVYRETLETTVSMIRDYVDGMFKRRFKSRSEAYMLKSTDNLTDLLAWLPRDNQELNEKLARFAAVSDIDRTKILCRFIHATEGQSEPTVRWSLEELPSFRLHRKIDRAVLDLDDAADEPEVDLSKVSTTDPEWFPYFLERYSKLVPEWIVGQTEKVADRWLLTIVDTPERQGMSSGTWTTRYANLNGHPRMPFSYNAGKCITELRDFVGDANIIYRSDRIMGHRLVVRDLQLSTVLVDRVAKLTGLSPKQARERLAEKDITLSTTSDYLDDAVSKMRTLIDKSLPNWVESGSLSE